MPSVDDFFLTFDIDWAPDFVIDYVADVLVENRVKATWFVTHQSEAVERLREQTELFELGIHPNALPGSTHGKTEDEVLKHILEIVPQAVSMRTHGLYQSSYWLWKASREYGVQIDVSLFLPRTAGLTPHKLSWNGSSIWRVPYFWEDDTEMFEDEPIWSVSDARLNLHGLKVFDFHPIHIALNTNRFEHYTHLKSIRSLSTWNEEFVKSHAYQGMGPQTMFLELVKALSGKGGHIRDIVKGAQG